MKQIFSITLLALLAGLLSSCDFHAQSKLVFDDNHLSPAGKAQLSFSTVKTQVLTENCLGCHNPERANDRKPDLSSYSAVMRFVIPGRPDQSKLFKSIRNNGGNMPKENPISSNENEVLRQWILAGAPEVATTPKQELETEPAPEPTPTPEEMPAETPEPKPEPTPEATPDGEPIPAPAPEKIPGSTFKEIKATILPRCVKCHSGEEPRGTYVIESYEDVVFFVEIGKPVEKSAFYTELANRSMPPKKRVESGEIAALTDEEIAGVKAWIEAGAKND